MIRLVGIEGTAEFRAGEKIRDFFESQWPGITETPEEKDLVVIRTGVFLSGQKRNEIDIVIVARLSDGRRIRPTRSIKDEDGRVIRDTQIYLKNFIAVGEEKSHSEERIKARGEEILVKYKNKNKWSSATQQNVEQLHSLNNVLADQNIRSWVCRFVFLSNVSERLRGASNPTTKPIDFFSSLLQTGTAKRRGPRIEFSSVSDVSIGDVFRAPILQTVTPTRLDRARMDLLVKQSRVVKNLVELSGPMVATISGVGGTGKTIAMLQTASKLYDQRGERSLFLTYNVALASDVQRLMGLASIKSEEESGGVKVQTAMSFFYSVLSKLDLGVEDIKDSSSFSEYKETLESLQILLKDTPEILKELIQRFPFDFHFDRVFVDEAQDWYQPEAEILKSLYDDVPLYVADGKQQMVRTKTPANWFIGVDRDKRHFERLEVCLRQKSSLSNFLHGLASTMEATWEAQTNSKAGGGRIIVTTKPYSETKLHEKLIEAAIQTDTDNIDWLFLVPPTSITHGSPRSSDLSIFLRSQGETVVDLVDMNVRRQIHSNPRSFRVIQYESCRGLEGWNVILHNFDTFIEMKICSEFNLDKAQIDSFETLGIKEKTFVWNWISMVSSRAMDTLVIHLSNPNSSVGKWLMDYCRSNRDMVLFESEDV